MARKPAKRAKLLTSVPACSKLALLQKGPVCWLAAASLVTIRVFLLELHNNHVGKFLTKILSGRLEVGPVHDKYCPRIPHSVLQWYEKLYIYESHHLYLRRVSSEPDGRYDRGNLFDEGPHQRCPRKLRARRSLAPQPPRDGASDVVKVSVPLTPLRVDVKLPAKVAVQKRRHGGREDLALLALLWSGRIAATYRVVEFSGARVPRHILMDIAERSWQVNTILQCFTTTEGRVPWNVDFISSVQRDFSMPNFTQVAYLVGLYERPDAMQTTRTKTYWKRIDHAHAICMFPCSGGGMTVCNSWGESCMHVPDVNKEAPQQSHFVHLLNSYLHPSPVFNVAQAQVTARTEMDEKLRYYTFHSKKPRGFVYVGSIGVVYRPNSVYVEGAGAE